MFKLLKTLLAHRVTAWLAVLLAIAPSLPGLRFLLASSMVFHMLIQLPMLIVAGCLLSAAYLPKSFQCSLYQYLSCWLWILLAGMFWMLPISLDKALLNSYWDLFKILTLLVSGILLRPALASPKILSLFFIGSTVMMLFFIGYFYQDSDLRLCNSYLLESQKTAGIGLILLAFAILFVAVYKLRDSSLLVE